MTKISLMVYFERNKQKIFLNFIKRKNQLKTYFFVCMDNFVNVLITDIKTHFFITFRY